MQWLEDLLKSNTPVDQRMPSKHNLTIEHLVSRRWGGEGLRGSPMRYLYLKKVHTRSPRLARPVSIIPSIPLTLVVGDTPKNRRQLIPFSPLAEVQRAVSRLLDTAMAEATDRSPDKMDRTVRVDPTSMRNVLLSVLSAPSTERSENVADPSQYKQASHSIDHSNLEQTMP